MGPGYHDTSKHGAVLGQRPITLPLPQSDRFGNRADASKNLGSTYNPEWCALSRVNERLRVSVRVLGYYALSAYHCAHLFV